jgi:hypothetical protein
VFGRNFGQTDSDPVVFIGPSACTSSFYFSDSVAMCIVPPGGGLHSPVTVSIGGQHVLTSSAFFDYESPVVLSVTPTVGPSYGGSVLTVTGSGFGTSADDATVFVGEQPCEASSWVSDSQMLCVSPRIDVSSSGLGEEAAGDAGAEGLAVTVRVFNQSSRSSATFVSSNEDVSRTEFNPGFGQPVKQKRGPFYVSVAYILAIALAAGVLLLGRHLMKRPAPSSLLSSYTGVRDVSLGACCARMLLSHATSGVARGKRRGVPTSCPGRVERSGSNSSCFALCAARLTVSCSPKKDSVCYMRHGRP